MSETSEEPLTEEERLQALLYQYLALYERWSEDRQVAAKRGAEHAELLKQFVEQVQAFKALVPETRQEISKSLRLGLAQALAEVSEPLQTKAKDSLDQSMRELDRAVYQAKNALSTYQTSYVQEMKRSQWKVMGMVMVACVLVSGLAIQLMKPKTLTGKELEWMYMGHLMNQVYPRLRSEEQAHWQRIANQITAEARAALK